MKKKLMLAIRTNGQEGTELRIQNSEQNSQISMGIPRRLINCILWFLC